MTENDRKWFPKPLYSNVVKSVSGIEAFLMTAQFRWTAHVIRMEDDRIPKRTLLWKVDITLVDILSDLRRTASRPISKHAASPHGARIPESLANLLQRYHRQIRRQQNTLSYLKDKQQRRKLRLMPGVEVASIPHGQFSCDVCGWIWVSRIILISQQRTYRWWDTSYRRLTPSSGPTHDIDRVSNSYVLL